MREIKKLGFGLMRLPLNSANGANGADIDMEQFKKMVDLFLERGDYSRETAKIGGAFDVTAALREAVETQSENSFQDYMD